jgi:hypothetical protein
VWLSRKCGRGRDSADAARPAPLLRREVFWAMNRAPLLIATNGDTYGGMDPSVIGGGFSGFAFGTELSSCWLQEPLRCDARMPGYRCVVLLRLLMSLACGKPLLP